MDAMVLNTQTWLNQTYGSTAGFDKAPENGQTGWPTVTALVEALQIELGFIDSFTGVFGSGTLAACPTVSKNTTSVSSNIIKIIQGGMWCKGYTCDGLTGVFGSITQEGISALQIDMGLNLDGTVTPYIFKSLLNMDAFTLVSTGKESIRKFQQDFNANYVIYNGYEYIPCDGRSGRESTTALILMIQALEGYSPSEATGFFGNSTANSFPNLSIDMISDFVYPLQIALMFNGYSTGIKTRTFNSTIKTAMQKFQKFMKLEVTGNVNGNMMKNLLISTGDAYRDVDGCDSAKPLDQYRIDQLKSYNYTTIGRYITPGAFSWGNKQLTKAEIELIITNGLRIFPIFQLSGDSMDYFTSAQGQSDAEAALLYARQLKIPKRTTIYFAVDYDFMEGELASTVIPYFMQINKVMSNNDFEYKIGIYGARNTCTKLADLTSTSFVSGMSTGYSGNLGFPMPNNWAFNQIATVDFLEIDNNVVSGRDVGFGLSEYNTEIDPHLEESMYFLNQVRLLSETARSYTTDNFTISMFVANYIRSKNPQYVGTIWTYTVGDISKEIELMFDNAINNEKIREFYDPRSDLPVGTSHLAASLASCLYPSSVNFTGQDAIIDKFSTWLGDLCTLQQGVHTKDTNDNLKDMSYSESACYLMANVDESVTMFSYTDFLGDIDAWNIYHLISDGKIGIYEALIRYYTDISGSCSRERTKTWVLNEYNGDLEECLLDIKNGLTTINPVYVACRKLLENDYDLGKYSDEVVEASYTAMQDFVNKEYKANR